ncbi:auxin-induced protein IAA4 isoform X1 [Morus notabilis]|uniref:auxin-induced protein IAA4 isoform X1 n=1 Tax=Morus notabilis TaxID=981085 RepID=UPI000CED4F49|nr:auxin-induced protein IAA4 isoform X1 [Morus notabilis]
MEMVTRIGKFDHDDDHLNLRLGLPGTSEAREKQAPSLGSRTSNKRALPEDAEDPGSNSKCSRTESANADSALPTKTQVVGWPPIRSYRKNNTQSTVMKTPQSDVAGGNNNYVKVSVDGAPYLRKIDLRVYKNYPELLKALESMFNLTIGNYSEREGYNNGSDYAPTYEDKDGDWMLVGDVPWDMFVCSCRRLRIMKGSEARGLGCA